MRTQDLVLPSLSRFPNLTTLQSVNLIVGFTIKPQRGDICSLENFLGYYSYRLSFSCQKPFS